MLRGVFSAVHLSVNQSIYVLAARWAVVALDLRCSNAIIHYYSRTDTKCTPDSTCGCAFLCLLVCPFVFLYAVRPLCPLFCLCVCPPPQCSGEGGVGKRLSWPSSVVYLLAFVELLRSAGARARVLYYLRTGRGPLCPSQRYADIPP